MSFGLRLASSRASRTVSSVTLANCSRGSRNLHKRRGLLYPIDGGLGEFLPPAALKTIAVDYQDGLLQRLNDEVRGTSNANVSVTQTVLNTAPDREKVLAFNYASQALNNSFFLDQLKPPPPAPAVNHQSDISLHLGNEIRMQHGSLQQLKSSFSAAATGMFTNGWVWFVTDKNGNTAVLPTFGPGTLLIRSRSYMALSQGLLLGEDLAQMFRGDPIPSSEANAAGASNANVSPVRPPMAQSSPPGVAPTSPTSGTSGTNTPQNPVKIHPRFMHSSARTSFEQDRMPSSLWDRDEAIAAERSLPQSKTDMLNIGEVLYPLFCVSVHEHAWMSAGYGVWGKEEWLAKFWTVVDWKKVSQSYEAVFPNRSDL